jgi:hypothetical protein
VKPAGVDCRFLADGTVRVRRAQFAAGWIAVETGRQWLDAKGRHVLIMLPDGTVRELLLEASTLQWRLISAPAGPTRLA